MNDAISQGQISRNVTVHDRLARKYDALHGEIFNDVEQARLHDALTTARDAVQTGADPVEALDFGCGSGNLSRHLLELGTSVTAADVSPGFLELVASRYGSKKLRTLHMIGGDLSGVPDASFDLIATYSVLHHIPDYLAACSELARLCKPGGVVMIDHEQNEAYWRSEPSYRAYWSAGMRTDWRKFLTPSNYVHRLRRVLNPRYTNEGDIHVFADDHIEWDKIKAVFAGAGFDVVREDDYLLYRLLCRPEVFDRYKDEITDTKAMIFRKRAG